MGDYPQNTSTPIPDHSSHIEDHDTRLSGSSMQVWSAPIPFSGGWTVDDFIFRFGKGKTSKEQI